MRILGIILLVAGFGALTVQGQLAGTGLELLPYILMGVAAILIVLSLGRPSGDSVDFESAHVNAPTHTPSASATAVASAAAERESDQVRAVLPGISEDKLAQIAQLIKKKQVIEAIKEVRQATGMGLKESKELVDRLRDRVK
ncbi:MAG: ribosomal protein L7/L12 [Bryobacteraceae bacterium]|nr:ribosomal protein L7/L12 [Bryobacteraceae bacterium]